MLIVGESQRQTLPSPHTLTSHQGREEDPTRPLLKLGPRVLFGLTRLICIRPAATFPLFHVLHIVSVASWCGPSMSGALYIEMDHVCVFSCILAHWTYVCHERIIFVMDM